MPISFTPGVLFAVIPWIALALWMGFRVREPRVLPAPGPGDGAAGSGAPSLPLVSFVVPARNEERNIVACLSSLVAQEYPAFEIVVVDDRSEDATAELARTVAPGRARSVRVVEGAPLPPGWFGKPWACAQGARVARGELLAFTDADTRHAPDLLARCVAALREDDAAAVSPLGRQEMVGFGERLVQPHIFALLGLRFPHLDRPIEPGRWRAAILSGQYTLVRRAAYEAIGGHEAVRGEVVEDLRLGQELVRAGHRISLRGGERSLSVRMYRSFPELVEGWSKNVAIGARQSAGRLAPVAVPGMVAFLVGVWIVPPAALLLAAGGALAPTWGTWAAGATGVSLAMWIGGYLRFGAPVRYAFLYPAGAAVAAFIALRSLVRGERRIEWKGRVYSGGSAAGDEGAGEEARSGPRSGEVGSG